MAKGCQLFIGHLGHFKKLGILICGNELFNDHETTTNSDNQFSIKNLSKDFLCTEEIESISKLFDGNKTVGLIDVMTKHLIKEITLWHIENWLLGLLSDSSFHYFNDFIFISKKKLDLLNVVNLLSYCLRELIESLN